MSSNDTYTPHPNSARWPFYLMMLFAAVICITFWRSCEFSGTSMDDAAPTPAAAPAQ
jgi:hypothetical protein